MEQTGDLNNLYFPWPSKPCQKLSYDYSIQTIEDLKHENQNSTNLYPYMESWNTSSSHKSGLNASYQDIYNDHTKYIRKRQWNECDRIPTLDVNWKSIESSNIFNSEVGNSYVDIYPNRTSDDLDNSFSSELSKNSETDKQRIMPFHSTKGILKSIEDIPFKYRSLFCAFPYFNIVQSTVFSDIFQSDRSVVVSAPTGSGKTVLLELAIIRMLIQCENSVTSSDFIDDEHKNSHKIIYMAPLKALVSERYLDWDKRLGKIGLICAIITGDTLHDDLATFKNAQVILTTPEKWDSLTRRWKDYTSLMKSIKLFLIDEVHILNEEMRGPTVEAVISRMKTFQSIYHKDKNPLRKYIEPLVTNVNGSVREQRAGLLEFSKRCSTYSMVAISATIPNVEDVASWLKIGKESASHYKLEEKLRPVQLRRVVLGYPTYEKWSDYRFDISLTYKLAAVIRTFSDNKPTLIFTSTRKGAQQTAFLLKREIRLVRDTRHKEVLTNVANGLNDSKLRECVLCGVGYHHAGVDASDRHNVEVLFIEGNLPVLVSTSTLAMGVNLPAHLVIIKSTSHYVSGEYKEYSSAHLLQMVGRAGRPQFDEHATAVIMTKQHLKVKYESLILGKDMLESHLHKHLMEHLNAEIVLGTIEDLSVAVEWLRSTFFYVRVQKNPQHYRLPIGLSPKQLEKKLQELCTKEVNALASAQLITMTDVDMKSTEAGKLMAMHCVSFPTMKSFLQIRGDESLKELLELLTRCQEFADIKIRSYEKRTLNDINKAALRFPIKGRIKTTSQKVNCLIQATLRCYSIGDYGLAQEVTKIFRIGKRLTKCLFEYSFTRKEYEIVLNALILSKIFNCHVWESSHLVAKQLERIGPTLATCLANAKFNSFTAIENADPRELELICNRQPPFGSRLKDQAQRLPQYEVAIHQIGEVDQMSSILSLDLKIANLTKVADGQATVKPNHSSVLLIGDVSNRIVYAQRVTDKSLIQSGGKITKKIHVQRSTEGDELYINFVSETWAGLDVQSVYVPRYANPAFAQMIKAAPSNEPAISTKSGQGKVRRRNTTTTRATKGNSQSKARKPAQSPRTRGSFKENGKELRFSVKTPSLLPFRFLNTKPKIPPHSVAEVPSSVNGSPPHHHKPDHVCLREDKCENVEVESRTQINTSVTNATSYSNSDSSALVWSSNSETLDQREGEAVKESPPPALNHDRKTTQNALLNSKVVDKKVPNLLAESLQCLAANKNVYSLKRPKFEPEKGNNLQVSFREYVENSHHGSSQGDLSRSVIGVTPVTLNRRHNQLKYFSSKNDKNDMSSDICPTTSSQTLQNYTFSTDNPQKNLGFLNLKKKTNLKLQSPNYGITQLYPTPYENIFTPLEIDFRKRTQTLVDSSHLPSSSNMMMNTLNGLSKGFYQMSPPAVISKPEDKENSSPTAMPRNCSSSETLSLKGILKRTPARNSRADDSKLTDIFDGIL